MCNQTSVKEGKRGVIKVHLVDEGSVTQGKESLRGAGKRGQGWKINVILAMALLSGLGADFL